MTLYNPHLLTRHELIETFLARQPLLDELVDDLRRGGRQHHVLVGNRGSGKTTLLLRLAAAIEDDKRLARTAIPLRFPEEQYNVSRPSDLWMNALDALVDALERKNDRAAAQQLEAAVIELAPVEESERATRALELLVRWARQTKRLVVLLIDNLDLILDRLHESLWALREVLSADNRLVVIGASSRFLEEMIDYQAPFYDFFHVHELGPVSESEARRVVLALARRAGTPRVAQVLKQDPGRFMALYALTGGTPRTLVLLHGVLALEHNDRIERDLEGLLDQLTPYYKARFDDLPVQSQLILDKVALHWHPITAAECQAATHLDVNTVSAQLNRLVKFGVLTKVALPGPSKLGFQVAERFFNTWYLMRASRRLRRRLSWFVEFLRMFYGEEDLRRRAESLVKAGGGKDDPASLLGFAAAVPDEALRRRLEFRAITRLLADGVAALREAIDVDGDDAHLAPIIDRVHALRTLRTQIASAPGRWPKGWSAATMAERIARAPMLPLRDKQLVASALKLDEADALRTKLGHLTELSIVCGERLLHAIGTGELPSLCDVTTLAEVCQVLELADSSWPTLGALVLCTDIWGSPLSEQILDQLPTVVDDAASCLVAAATVHAADGRWPRARQLLQVVHRASQLAEIDFLLPLSVVCAGNGLEAELAQLFIDLEITERLGPLYEALRAVVERSRARIDSLAPEVRAPALAIFEKLGGPARLPVRAYRVNPADTRGDIASDSAGAARTAPRRRGRRRRRQL